MYNFHQIDLFNSKAFMQNFRFSNQLFVFLLLAVNTVLFSSCKKEEHAHDHNDSELITTLRLRFTEVGTTNTTTFAWTDKDGAGGNAPTIDEVRLAPNKSYTLDITVLNESKTPSEDITAEILKEANEHQFFFEGTAINNLLNVVYADTDTNRRPLGLKNTVATRNAGNSTLKITLRHSPNKAATGVAQGQIANAGGETDIETTFNVRVQ